MRRISLILLGAVLLLTSCAAKSEPVTKDFVAMDTVMSVTVYGGDSGLADGAAETIADLDAELSVTREDSAVYRLNHEGTAEFSDSALTLLQKAQAVQAETDGCLSPSLYALTSLWGFTTGQYQVPSEEARTQALLACQGTITVSGHTVSVEGGAMLDFGAVAKGYAGQIVSEELAAAGAEGALLTLGGNIQTVGNKPDGSDWRVAIRDPWDTAAQLGVLTFSGGKAVVTSGGYERYFEENGKRYCHIMNPHTGCPADNDLCSVTIVSEDGFLADALSTALYVMGFDRAVSFYRDGPYDFEGVLCRTDGSVYVTDGLNFSCEKAQVLTP